ncbi:hypothetical protein, partial [Staphylococcus epidermidis]|uniref:hypothetical protein n=1 Tax=Staphylococcus epidermidis TaxID=1282 RepID=UPI001C92E8DB
TIPNPQPFQSLNQLPQPFKQQNKHQQLIHLINHLPIIFIKPPYDQLQKTYHLFSIIQTLHKHLELIQTQPIFITKPIQRKLLNT